MRINVNDISLPVAIAALSVACTTAFQFGYFCAVGLEFASLASATEFIMPLLSSVIGLMFLVIPPLLLHAALVQSKRLDGPYYKFRNFVGRNKFILRMLIYAVFIIVFTITAPTQLENLTPYIIILFTFLLTINAFFQLASAMNGLESPNLEWLNVLWASMLILALLGYCYATLFPSRECLLIKSDSSSLTVTYLRSLGNGHLVRTSTATSFLSKESIKEISCKNERWIPTLISKILH